MVYFSSVSRRLHVKVMKSRIQSAIAPFIAVTSGGHSVATQRIKFWRGVLWGGPILALADQGVVSAATGAAYGWLISNAIVALGLWGGFLRAIGRIRDDAPAREVIGNLVGTFNSKRWTITYLGEGDHSTVYTARSNDGGPIWRTHDTLILKVYKPEAQLTIDMVNTQFDSLLRLHQSLNGRQVDGWTIAIPMPLHVCKAPLALLMTAVSGNDLKSSIANNDDLTLGVMQSLGRTLVKIMRPYWSHNQVHGDIGLQNILYDVRMRQLALIDPGTPECCVVCMQKDARWKPEILELGHIVRDLGTDIHDLTGHRAAWLRRKAFTESALRTRIESIGSAEERRQTLGEIFDCAQEHLAKVIQASWLLRTFFATFLTRFVAWRINAVLAGFHHGLTSIDQATLKSDEVFLQPPLQNLMKEPSEDSMKVRDPVNQP